MKKHMSFLAVAMVMLLAFTACNRNTDTNVSSIVPEPTYGDTVDQEPINNIDEMITVRFYYHSIEIDPDIYLPPESFLYNEEHIPAQNLTEEFIRLMYEHTGLRILDFWFEADKLYVDLHEDAIAFFNSYGTAGGSRNTRIFEKSLLSLPGIASFEVLINGQRGVERYHFNLAHVAIVENGEVVRREFFDMADDDFSEGNFKHELWIDLGIISIPPILFYEEAGPHGGISIIGEILQPYEDIWGSTWLHASPFLGPLSLVETIAEWEKSPLSERFVFNDGHVGYMAKNDEYVIWVREDNGTNLTLRHGGDISIFTNLILEIARTLN
jgi:hypothetical protein